MCFANDFFLTSASALCDKNSCQTVMNSFLFFLIKSSFCLISRRNRTWQLKLLVCLRVSPCDQGHCEEAHKTKRMSNCRKVDNTFTCTGLYLILNKNIAADKLFFMSRWSGVIELWERMSHAGCVWSDMNLSVLCVSSRSVCMFYVCVCVCAYKCMWVPPCVTVGPPIVTKREGSSSNRHLNVLLGWTGQYLLLVFQRPTL